MKEMTIKMVKYKRNAIIVGKLYLKRVDAVDVRRSIIAQFIVKSKIGLDIRRFVRKLASGRLVRVRLGWMNWRRKERWWRKIKKKMVMKVR
jgi:hypothetical protein